MASSSVVRRTGICSLANADITLAYRRKGKLVRHVSKQFAEVQECGSTIKLQDIPTHEHSLNSSYGNYSHLTMG